MKELMGVTPMRIRIFLFGFFIFWSFGIAFACTFVAFVSGACLFICAVHFVVNMPAIKCTEDPLYEGDPQRFFDLKVKFTLRLWAIGIIIMVIAFVSMEGLRLIMVDAQQLYVYEVPQVDFVSSLVLMVISLTPFVPATFVLMKASYKYDDRMMGGISLALLMMGLIGVFTIAAAMYSIRASSSFPSFDILPYLPLSICALAASVIATSYLVKSAKRSFVRYIEGDNT